MGEVRKRSVTAVRERPFVCCEKTSEQTHTKHRHLISSLRAPLGARLFGAPGGLRTDGVCAEGGGGGGEGRPLTAY